MTVVRGRRAGLASSELAALEAERAREAAACPTARPSPPMRGWASLRFEIEDEFRALGAKVYREERSKS